MNTPSAFAGSLYGTALEHSDLIKFGDGGTKALVSLGDHCGFLHESCSKLMEAVERALGEFPCTSITFDLSGAATISSSFLAFLIALKRRGMTIELRRTSDSVQEYLDVTKLNTLFEIRVE